MLIALTAVVLSGCNFFDNNSPSAMDDKKVFSDPVVTEQAIAAVYDQMGANNSYRNRIGCGFAGLNTDVEWSTQSTSSTAGAKALVLYDCGISNDRISSTTGQDIWSYLNTMIERCNNAIEGISAYGDIENNATMRYYLGEVLFLRSFAYLEMVKYWGDVPARFESVAKNPNGVTTPKSDRNLIYDQIRKDLKEAAEYMPWSEEIPVATAKNNVGRASKGSALAMLARVDLMYAGKAVRPGADGHDVKEQTAYKVTFNVEDAAVRRDLYAEVLDACAQVINHEDYKLSREDFAKPFMQICANVTAYDQMEHIWAMPFKYGSRGQILNYNAAKIPSDAQSGCAAHLPGYGSGGSSSGSICAGPALFTQFEKGDKRLPVTVVFGQWTYDNGKGESSDAEARALLFPEDPTGNANKLYQKHGSAAGFYMGKYRFEWYALGGGNLTSTDDGVMFPVLRYSDVLLMFAEAELGGRFGDVPTNNTTLSGLEQLNKVRTRAGLAKLSAYNFDDIDHERAVEFAGEYIRKYDLMRWGMLRERMVETEKFVREMSVDASRHALGYGDSIFYKYTYNETAKGYYISEVYGLRKGETERQAHMTKANGWQAKDIYNSDSKGYLLSATNYPIFADEQQLETRQYWPIFVQNITAAGTDVLWNNYGYGN